MADQSDIYESCSLRGKWYVAGYFVEFDNGTLDRIKHFEYQQSVYPERVLYTAGTSY